MEEESAALLCQRGAVLEAATRGAGISLLLLHRLLLRPLRTSTLRALLLPQKRPHRDRGSLPATSTTLSGVLLLRLGMLRDQAPVQSPLVQLAPIRGAHLRRALPVDMLADQLHHVALGLAGMALPSPAVPGDPARGPGVCAAPAFCPADRAGPERVEDTPGFHPQLCGGDVQDRGVLQIAKPFHQLFLRREDITTGCVSIFGRTSTGSRRGTMKLGSSTLPRGSPAKSAMKPRLTSGTSG